MKMEAEFKHRDGNARIVSKHMSIEFRIVETYDDQGEMPRLEGLIYTGDDGRIVISFFDLAGGNHKTLSFTNNENGLQEIDVHTSGVGDDHPCTRDWGKVGGSNK